MLSLNNKINNILSKIQLMKVNETQRPAKYFIYIIIFITISISIISVYYDDFRNAQSELIPATEPLGQILDGQIISQEFFCDENGLQSIKIFLATYSRTNYCSFVAKLYDNNGQLLQSWDIKTKNLKDNTYYTLMLDEAISDSNGKRFFLELISNGNDGNAITVYKNSSEGYSGLNVNGQPLNGQSLCYQIEYKITPRQEHVFYIMRFTAIILVIFIIWITMQVFSLSIIKSFLLLWVSLSILYTCSNTLFNVPDETNHFFRAYEISLGGMVSEHNEELNLVGRELPLDVELELLQTSWLSFGENKNTLYLSQNNVFKNFPNTALYAPVSYIPQAFGIYIARCFTQNITLIAYTGRLFNWITITIFLCLSLKILPSGKEFFALVALTPMNIHESVSLAPDGMVVALSAFLVSFVLYLREMQKTVLSKLEIVILYIVALAISLYKIVYLPFLLFYFLIPNVRFRHGWKEKALHAGLVSIMVILVSLFWLNTCSEFLIQPGTDSDTQLAYLLSHPIRYYLTVIRTIMNNASTLVFLMVGSQLAWLNVPTVGMLIMIYIIYLAYQINISTSMLDKAQKDTRLISISVIITIIFLTYTSLYIQWTAVYQPNIDGLQGRYFIPLLLPMYLFLTKDLRQKEHSKTTISFKSQWIVLLTNICACGSLLFACLG